MTTKGVPVLMYHALEDEQHPAGAKDQGEQIYIVTVDNFRKQMQYLHDNGFKTYFIDELIHMDSWPQKAVVLTFDDGHESNYTLALPILQEFGFKAEFFITTDWIGTKHFLKPEQIIELHKAGMAIGSHSVTHPYFDDLSKNDIEREFRDSKSSIECIINSKITSFSAPGGRLNNSAVNIAKRTGYQTIFTSVPGAFKKSGSLFEISRFAMRQHTSHDDFISIINKSFALQVQIKAKSLFLFMAKKVLGNNTYERIRASLLPSCQQQKEKRILHLISTKAFLGAERVLAELCTCADNKNFELSIGIIQRNKDIVPIFKKNIHNEQVTIISFSCNKQFDLLCLKKIRAFLIANQITIIHSHGYKSNFYALASKIFLRRRVQLLATNHLWKSATIKEKVYNYFDAFILRFFDKIIAVSSDIRQEMINAGISKTKINVIDNGINVEDEDFGFSRRKAREILKLDDSDIVIGSVGSLTVEKGHKILLQSIQYLTSRPNTNTKIVIVGDGPERDILTRFIADNNLGTHVIMAGRRNDARKLYSAFDIFALPSFSEGLPMVMLEAMAASLPVVASRVGGIPGVIVHNMNGLLVAPGAHHDIADKINTLIHDKDLFMKLATNARSTVEKHYSSKTMTKSYENLYTQRLA